MNTLANASGFTPCPSFVTDISTNGAIPDANGNGSPSDDTLPTNVTFSESPRIGVAKAVVAGPTNNGDGTYSLTYRILVGNSGNVPVNGVQVVDNLAATFAGATGFVVNGVTGTGLTANALFNGTTNTNLLTGASALATGASGTVDVQVTVTPGANLGPFGNSATGNATSSGGAALSDVSTTGSNPDANGNGNPGDDSTPLKHLPKVQVKTYHANGLGILSKNFGRGQLDEDKDCKLIKSYLSFDDARILQSPIKKLIGMVKNNLTETDDETLLDLCWHYGIELNGSQRLVFDTIRYCIDMSKRNTKTISFDDMVWLPVVLNLRGESYDYVLVDELQDTNKPQSEGIAKVHGETTRIIGVGDPNQSIY